MGFRDVGSYLKLGEQVVMWRAHSSPSSWDRVNWSAKTWVGNCSSCPPISYVLSVVCYLPAISTDSYKTLLNRLASSILYWIMRFDKFFRIGFRFKTHFFIKTFEKNREIVGCFISATGAFCWTGNGNR